MTIKKTASVTHSANRCPLCGAPNHCRADAPDQCWCQKIKIPPELLALVPPDAIGKACICQNCVRDFLNNPEQFKARLNAKK